jgi:hypothetical protein
MGNRKWEQGRVRASVSDGRWAGGAEYHLRAMALRRLAILAIVVAAVAVGLSGQLTARAHTIDVDETYFVTPGDGFCSIVEAIVNANEDAQIYADCDAGSGADVLELSPYYWYAMQDINGFATHGPDALPLIKGDLTINGNHARIERYTTTRMRVMEIAAGANVTINDLTIAGGYSRDGTDDGQPGDDGGGIYNAGSLLLNNVTVTNNTTGAGSLLTTEVTAGASGGNGGGIFNEGTLVMNYSTVTGNLTGAGGRGREGKSVGGPGGNGGGGGGIASIGTGAITINRSTIADNGTGAGGDHGVPAGQNGTPGSGGGVYNYGTQLMMTSSTVSGNSAGAQGVGGGIYHRSPAVDEPHMSHITNSTITGNVSDAASGIMNDASYLYLENDTIALNSPVGVFNSGIIYFYSNIVVGPGNACAGGGSFHDFGYNIDDSTTCLFVAPTSQQSTNPQFDAFGLQDNGGPTKTIALHVNSPAIDAIPNSTNGCGGTIALDQRGVTRPTGGGCEIGAFEVGTPPSNSPTPVFTPTGSPTLTPTPIVTAVATPTLTPTPIVTPVLTPTLTPTQDGDVNCDTQVDFDDVLLMLKVFGGVFKKSNGCAAPGEIVDQRIVGDLTSDGFADVRDALCLLRLLVQIDFLPCGGLPTRAPTPTLTPSPIPVTATATPTITPAPIIATATATATLSPAPP